MHTDPLSIQLSALADPTRRAILARLSEGERSVNDLAEPFAMSLPAISRHLKVLEMQDSSAAAAPRNGGRPSSNRWR
jgi:DNA-binding transcriptional ArsR family regulator